MSCKLYQVYTSDTRQQTNSCPVFRKWLAELTSHGKVSQGQWLSEVTLPRTPHVVTHLVVLVLVHLFYILTNCFLKYCGSVMHWGCISRLCLWRFNVREPLNECRFLLHPMLLEKKPYYDTQCGRIDSTRATNTHDASNETTFSTSATSL